MKLADVLSINDPPLAPIKGAKSAFPWQAWRERRFWRSVGVLGRGQW